MAKEIYSVELEQQVLACILKFPEKFFEFSDVITDADFYDKQSLLHVTIFRVLKGSLEKNESLDPVVVYQKVRSQGIAFQDPVDVLSYLKSLQVRYIAENQFRPICQELKKITVRREMFKWLCKAGNYVCNVPETASYQEIVETVDKLCNKGMSNFDSGEDDAVPIFKNLLAHVEDRADNPEKYNIKVSCPYPILADVTGSILRPGHVAVIVSNSGVGKTTWTMDYCLKSSLASGIPVLHFDNGEMSAEELMLRQAASATGVDYNLFEECSWRNVSPEVTAKVRAKLEEYSKVNYDYYNVAGMTADEMAMLLKKHYYTKVGRGKELIFLFDYIKPPTTQGNQSEWSAVGEMVDKLKQAIHKKITYENRPMISMLTSVQANRNGIVGKKSSAEVIDDESIVSLSSRIMHYCSYMMVLRRMTLDEKMTYGQEFGTHILSFLKTRVLGRGKNKILHDIKMPDGSLQKFFITFNFENFGIEESGDLTQIAAKLSSFLKQGPANSVVPDATAPKKTAGKKKTVDKNSEGVYTPQLSLTDAAEKESPESTPA